MTTLDVIIFLGYLAALLVIGGYFSTKQKDSSEMFAAGGRSPWWVSGLSGFMTIFSAGTFVVWGGVAYRLGLVSVSILTAIGFSMLGVGKFLAGRWKAMGITTPAEYVEVRFNKQLVHVYSWMGVICRMLGMAVALYALTVMLAKLINLPEGVFLRNATTGQLDTGWAIIICGVVIVAYTMAGGLWAVLMTDVIQCLVLCLSVLIVVPLALGEVGGVSGFMAKAPEAFFHPAAEDYTWGFLILWMIINFFQFGSDWAFIQRYVCVPSPKDARKSAYLMGILYLVSPVIWMLPPMIYRVMNPNANHEEAYILICQKVLPAGMVGIVIAAMFSATASMISSQLNVYAGVITCNIYRDIICKDASEKHLVAVGRFVTLAYGVLVIVMALLIPRLGGAEEVVMFLVVNIAGPLTIPLAWGLFSRKLTPSAVAAAIFSAILAAAFFKFGILNHELHLQLDGRGRSLGEWMVAHRRLVDGAIGLLIPVGILAMHEFISLAKSPAAGWRRLQTLQAYRPQVDAAAMSVSAVPAIMVASALWVLAVVTLIIGLLAKEQKITLFIFTAILAALGGVIWMLRPKKGSMSK